jgi:hypothetical protein
MLRGRSSAKTRRGECQERAEAEKKKELHSAPLTPVGPAHVTVRFTPPEAHRREEESEWAEWHASARAS